MMTHLQVAADTTLVPVGHDGSLLDLFTQAGGFQWPILAVLLAGLMTLTLAGVRLFSDHPCRTQGAGLARPCRRGHGSQRHSARK